MNITIKPAGRGNWRTLPIELHGFGPLQPGGKVSFLHAIGRFKRGTTFRVVSVTAPRKSAGRALDLFTLARGAGVSEEG